MQEKALVAHLELHKKVVKNAWILSYEGRKVLVIEFQENVTEDESIAYIFALAKSLVSGKGSETISPELMKMVKGTYVRILDLLITELKWRNKQKGDRRHGRYGNN